MTRFKLIACGIISTLFLHSCNKILEPVSLFDGKQDVEAKSVQEDFEINIKSLTFKSAREANNSPYPRRLMQYGIGSEANVFDEADFVNPNIPPLSENIDYLLGSGDKLLFTRLNQFISSTTQFPSAKIVGDYLLGIGDELTLIQLNEVESVSSITSADNSTNGDTSRTRESILKTSSVVGSDGNILLLSLGSIKAEGRSLSDIQTEVRNILIRNGVAPNFQLEITGFNSKKAFVTTPRNNQFPDYNSVSITSLPITLKELAINYGLRPSSKDTTIISLTRDGQKFRMTAGQMFDKSTPRIIIKDRDQIEINEEIVSTESIEAVVGSKGNILLQGIGSFKAENRTLAEVQADVSRVLLKKGLIPSFQLEITDFKSKKFFMTKSYASKAIALTSSKLNIRDAILTNIANLNAEHVRGNNFNFVELVRNGISYRMSLREILSGGASKVLIQDGDTINLKHYEYKLGQVFALNGAGNAQMVPIDPSKRETLADILFASNGALNNLMAKRSEVYLLRGRNPSVAYHLDAQNVSRILVAAQTELRPNDIVYVADRSIISFSRTLNEILPLRILLRDIQNNNIP